MRPTLNVLTDELITQVLDEAKRIMAEPAGAVTRKPETRVEPQ